MQTLTLADGRAVRWDPRTGRGFFDPSDPRARDVRERQLRVGEALDSWIPQRSRHLFWAPGTGRIWAPCPLVHTPSGHGYGYHPVDPALWAAINDSRTVAQIADRVNLDPDEVLEALSPLMDIAVQAIQLWPHRVSPTRLTHLLSPRRPDHELPTDRFDGATTRLGAYHAGIASASEQFDARETTVAHVLAPPHPGLDGRPYGAALRRALEARAFDTHTMVEVGCGTGELSRDWGAAQRLRIDLSPALLAAQGRTAPGSSGVRGDAVRLPLREGSVRCLVSNEVLADLPSTFAGVWDNHGARAFVDEIARVLEPGGRACVTEFGVLEGDPEQARQLDHPEVSIQFTDLAEHARTLGLQADLVPLAELLDLDLGAEQLSRHSWRALRAWCSAEGIDIETRAWTRRTLPLPIRLEGLRWSTLAHEGPGPLVTRFYALLLRR